MTSQLPDIARLTHSGLAVDEGTQDLLEIQPALGIAHCPQVVKSQPQPLAAEERSQLSSSGFAVVPVVRLLRRCLRSLRIGDRRCCLGPHRTGNQQRRTQGQIMMIKPVTSPAM